LKEILNPYPGLRPFEADESHLFFGRERHIAEVLRKLDARRFVSVVGNSGSGKSSLVKAGILPALEEQNGEWLLCTTRPGDDPIASILQSLLDDGILDSKGLEKEGGIEILRKSDLGLIQVLRHSIPEKKKLLILVDQFEELFRFAKIHYQEHFETATHFVQLLLKASAQVDIPIYVMMTLRSDFLGDCEQFMGLPEAINDGQFLVPRMNRSDLQQCLVGPMRLIDGKISPRLVQKLLDEIGNNPDQLPILQHVLMRTFEVWKSENTPELPLDIAHYEQTGGMKMAMSNHAEEAFSELKNKEQRVVAEGLFKTITTQGADNRGVRRPTKLSDIAQIVGTSNKALIEVVEIFRRSDRGFIMPPASVPLSEASILDISHESLMRVWDRLKLWVQEEADSAELYLRITENATLYDQEKAGLWRDPDLQIAVDWRENDKPNEHWAKQYNPNFKAAMRFIEASEADKKFILLEKKRRRKITNVAILAFLAALSALSIWALTERNRSAENAKAAIAGKLEADKQQKMAEKQKLLAESNYQKAKTEEQKALDQQLETEKQRKLALQKAEEARIAKMLAEGESAKAITAKIAAERERRLAEAQKTVSDSLRIKSVVAEKNAQKLRLQALAQNIAIKSKLTDGNDNNKEIKSLLALQAYKFNKEAGGKELDPEVFEALFASYRLYQPKSEYIHRIHKAEVKSLSFNAQTSEIASTGFDGIVVVSQKDNLAKNSSTLQEDLLFDNISYRPDGNMMALSCSDESIHLIDPKRLNQSSVKIKNLHKDKIVALDWFNGKIATASLDTMVRIFSPDNYQTTRTYKLPFRPLSMDANASAGLILVGTETGLVYSLNTETANDYKLLYAGGSGRINCISINQAGTKFAIGTDQGGCLLLSATTGKVLVTLSGHTSGITKIQFSPNDHLLATSSHDQKVRMYDLKNTSAQPIVFGEHDSWVYDVAFSPDGQLIASCSRDKSVRTYPANIETMLAVLRKNVKRNLTLSEWNSYISEDIEYQKTLD
jgi:WD40 repeat protein/energy-coupling factor transporter ATP-binding protein EcfA2